RAVHHGEGRRESRDGAAIAFIAGTAGSPGAAADLIADEGAATDAQGAGRIDPAAGGSAAERRGSPRGQRPPDGLVAPERRMDDVQGPGIVDAAAQGGTGGVNLVGVDDRIGDRRAATGRADTATLGRRLVLEDIAGGDVQRALVEKATAGGGGVATDGAV